MTPMRELVVAMERRAPRLVAALPQEVLTVAELGKLKLRRHPLGFAIVRSPTWTEARGLCAFIYEGAVL